MTGIEIQGVPVPLFLYGTAWKEERTESLVDAALEEGFTGIDTANQRKHYHEAGAGAAIRKVLAAGTPRQSLFVQTKYTYVEGQDDRLPYDPQADYPTQVRQSFESSLIHLGVDYLDSYLIHGPRTRRGWSTVDQEVWRTMEDLHRDRRVRLLGVSNVTAEQVSTLCEIASVKPAFVQNRCYARLGWDRAVREVCRRHGVLYQGFSLLTANSVEISSRAIATIASRHGTSRTTIIFAFALHVGMICLTGTTDREHMRADLAAANVKLTEEEVEIIERIAG